MIGTGAEIVYVVRMVELLTEHTGGDNRRWRVALDDGATVEAVLYRGDSLCISSQVGCAVGCPFCASGAQGFGRNLRLEELRGQVEAVRRLGIAVRRVTVSGVGEPLHSHADVSALLHWCRAQDLGLSLTTSGGPVARLREWLVELPHRGLTVSVHAGTETVRRQMVPRGPALHDLFATLRSACQAISASRRRKVALAYLLLAGVNDHDEEIDAFVERARPLGLKLSLYAYNPVANGHGRAVSEPRYHAIATRLRTEGFDVRRSSQARTQPNGGCGTLLAVRPAGPRRHAPSSSG
ncbi:MAG: radical SAM protein [Nannocystaceae bacterium]